MDFTISLAHFCEIHGPTSIICTQASTAPCTTCNPCVTPPTDDCPPSGVAYNARYHHSMKAAGPQTPLSSPFDTPPTSPRSPSHNPYFPSLPASHASFESDPDVCENCSIVLPKKYSDSVPTAASGSPSKDRRGKSSSPVLRTSQNFPVRGSADDLSSSPDLSDVSDSEQSRSFDSSPSYPASIPASPTFSSRGMHTHTLTYVSTSQPQSPATYSLLRRTCIRTLSCEALPCGKPSGPLMFGDSVAGYTIAYIFRLQDPRSRGAKRTYALIAMAGRDCRRASKAMVKVTEVFEAIANRIVALAEKVLEKEKESAAANFSQSGPAAMDPITPPPAFIGSSGPSFTPYHRAVSSVTNSPTTHITPVSSFLSAKKVDPDGYPRVSRDVMQPKTLVEIVGMESFFVELHAWFCTLLQSLIKEFGA